MDNELTTEVEFVAARYGKYSNYVFKDMSKGGFIMCTLLPNWQIPSINMGDRGFLQYKKVKAGEEYITPSGYKIKYKYAAIYLVNFVNKISGIINNDEIIF